MSDVGDIVVRPASDEDTEAVRAALRAAFGREAEAGLVDELGAGEAFVPELSLVAEADGRVVGHVLFTRAHAGSVAAVLLAPLAAVPDRQGRGVGSALVRAGLERAAELGFGVALVLGNPGYYARFGFEPAEPRGILPPYPVEPCEAWMVAELRSGALGQAAGIVYLADPFMREELWRE